MVSSSSTSTFVVWSGADGDIIHIPYTYGHRLWFETQFWNPSTVHRFFNRYWSLSVWIAIGYAVSVHLLQWFWRDKEPLKLRRLLIVWNSLLALFSLCATIRFGEEVVHVLRSRPFDDSLCYSIDPMGVAAFWACAFAISKIVELCDTLFVVLRKRELIFLHWYHHATVLVYSWNSACELTAAGRWFIFMNFAVHSIMYTYYAIRAVGIKVSRSIAMIVTLLQTGQMLIGVGISIKVLYLKLYGTVCQQSMDNLALCFAIYLSFAMLFLRYFYKAYMDNSHKEKLT